jgi:hypothetical protein
MSGLRSIGTTDPPAGIAFWDRSQPAPDPAADYYAQYMHAAKDRADALAKRSARPPGRTPEDGEASEDRQDDEQLASRDRDATDPDARRRAEPIRAETIHVTLGAPEPLPALAGRMDTDIAWTASPTSSPDNPQSRETDPAPLTRVAAQTADVRRDADEVPKGRSAPPPTRLARPASPDGKTILAQSAAKVRSLDTYQVKIARIERVGGRTQPEEQILLSIRRDPKAVRLEWSDGPNQGREVIYSTQLDARSLFVRMPKSAISLPRMKIPIDSPLIMKNSRHSIAEAGLDTIIANLQKAQETSQQNDLGRLEYRGVEKPPGLNRPSHVFTRRTPSGETWTVFLDARTLLPCMTVAKNPKGELDERYVYHEVRENPTELASADAFDPDRRWGESNGLLSRFARAAMGADSSNNRRSTTR